MNTESTTPETIVFIHGMWMTPLSWEHWMERYTARGHQVLAPAWPGLDAEPEQLRRDPSPLRGLGIADIVDHYEAIIRGLDRPPIIIGHSFGGLHTQLLLDRGLGAAGVALDTAAPKGVLRLPFSTFRAAWPALNNPANLKKETPLTFKQFHCASRTRSARRTRRRSTSVTTSPERRVPSSRRAWRTSIRTP